MRRTYIDGQRVRRDRRVRKILTDGQAHHVMVTDLPWWRIALGWAKFWSWYRWQSESKPAYTEEILTDEPWCYWPLAEPPKDGG